VNEGERASSWRDDDGLHVDVRGLPPPQPMVTLLTLIDSLAEPTLIAHLDRDPIYLHPELAERGWGAQRIAGDAGEVRIRLHRLA
jgi:hypothetical protein